MKIPTVLFGLLALAASPLLDAQPGGKPPACTPPPHCSTDDPARRLQFPAQALSYGPLAAFSAQARGMRWESNTGIATLTVRRPLDYAGGEVTFAIFHEFIGDDAGDIAFIVTPVSFNHGSSFETYGDELTQLLPAAESPQTMYQQSATFSSSGSGGYQWPPGGEWWYFEIRRAGSFAGPLQLLSVSIDY